MASEPQLKALTDAASDRIARAIADFKLEGRALIDGCKDGVKRVVIEMREKSGDAERLRTAEHHALMMEGRLRQATTDALMEQRVAALEARIAALEEVLTAPRDEAPRARANGRARASEPDQ